MQRDHAGARGNLAIGADAADVVRIAQPVHRDAMLLRRPDRPFDRLMRDHLAVAGPRVPDRDRAGVRDDLRRLVDLQRAGLEVAHIGDEHPDAVAVMAAQVRLDQMIGNERRLIGRTAACGDDAVGECTQPGVIDDHVFSLSRRLIGQRITPNAGRMRCRACCLVGIDAKPQCLRAHERYQIVLPLPGAGFRQRRDQFVIGLRAIRRTGPVFHRAGDEDHGIARHRKLALAALAPEFEHHLAGFADLQIGIRFDPGCGSHRAASPFRTESRHRRAPG